MTNSPTELEVLRAQRDALREALRSLLAAFPELTGQFATESQQRSLRAAYAAVEARVD